MSSTDIKSSVVCGEMFCTKIWLFSEHDDEPKVTNLTYCRVIPSRRSAYSLLSTDGHFMNNAPLLHDFTRGFWETFNPILPSMFVRIVTSGVSNLFNEARHGRTCLTRTIYPHLLLFVEEILGFIVPGINFLRRPHHSLLTLSSQEELKHYFVISTTFFVVAMVSKAIKF